MGDPTQRGEQISEAERTSEDIAEVRRCLEHFPEWQLEIAKNPAFQRVALGNLVFMREFWEDAPVIRDDIDGGIVVFRSLTSQSLEKPLEEILRPEDLKYFIQMIDDIGPVFYALDREVPTIKYNINLDPEHTSRETVRDGVYIAYCFQAFPYLNDLGVVDSSDDDYEKSLSAVEKLNKLLEAAEKIADEIDQELEAQQGGRRNSGRTSF